MSGPRRTSVTALTAAAAARSGVSPKRTRTSYSPGAGSCTRTKPCGDLSSGARARPEGAEGPREGRRAPGDEQARGDRERPARPGRRRERGGPGGAGGEGADRDHQREEPPGELEVAAERQVGMERRGGRGHEEEERP